jgi:hypothetical protein
MACPNQQIVAHGPKESQSGRRSGKEQYEPTEKKVAPPVDGVGFLSALIRLISVIRVLFFSQ